MEVQPSLGHGPIQGGSGYRVQAGQGLPLGHLLAFVHQYLGYGTRRAKGQGLPVGEDQAAVGGDLIDQIAKLDGDKLLVVRQSLPVRTGNEGVDAIGCSGGAQQDG